MAPRTRLPRATQTLQRTLRHLAVNLQPQARVMPVTPESHSARYFALLYSPVPQRLALDALFGIEREISESLRPGLDHHVAHSRLQWWREECERAAAGRPVHPLTRALVDAVTAVSSSTSPPTSPAASKRHRKHPSVELRSGPPSMAGGLPLRPPPPPDPARPFRPRASAP